MVSLYYYSSIHWCKLPIVLRLPGIIPVPLTGLMTFFVYTRIANALGRSSAKMNKNIFLTSPNYCCLYIGFCLKNCIVGPLIRETNRGALKTRLVTVTCQWQNFSWSDILRCTLTAGRRSFNPLTACAGIRSASVIILRRLKVGQLFPWCCGYQTCAYTMQSQPANHEHVRHFHRASDVATFLTSSCIGAESFRRWNFISFFYGTIYWNDRVSIIYRGRDLMMCAIARGVFQSPVVGRSIDFESLKT